MTNIELKFIVDNNAGKLARWLRMIGYDTLLFKGDDDKKLIDGALSEGRILLTKDTQIMRRRIVTNGKLKVILIEDDDPKTQLVQIVKALNLDYRFRPFSLCLKCNQSLIPRSRQEVKDLVPHYVFRTQSQYMECPACHRLYWRGTHWQTMKEELEELSKEK